LRVAQGHWIAAGAGLSSEEQMLETITQSKLRRPPKGRRLARHMAMTSQFCCWMALLAASNGSGYAPAFAEGQGMILQDSERKVVTLADGQGHLKLRLNYGGKCVLDRVTVRGREVAAESGVASGIQVEGRWYTTRLGIPTPDVAVHKNTLTITGIAFGKPGAEVRETWKFTVKPDGIVWRIGRRYPLEVTLEDSAFPEWNFADMSTWTGGLLGNGGVVWNKYLETKDATYGVHTGAVTFWNRHANDCLRIVPTIPGNQHGSARFSHQYDEDRRKDTFAFDYSVSGDELKPKHKFYRWLADRQDVWGPFAVKPGTVNVELSLQALDYNETYNRGTFKGLDGGSIRELMHTVGRYGVIDNRLVGANGWRTGNICLHEPFFGQIGFAVDDPDYTANLAAALDYERDHAIGKDGRVKSRWTYDDFRRILRGAMGIPDGLPAGLCYRRGRAVRYVRRPEMARRAEIRVRKGAGLHAAPRGQRLRPGDHDDRFPPGKAGQRLDRHHLGILQERARQRRNVLCAGPVGESRRHTRRCGKGRGIPHIRRADEVRFQPSHRGRRLLGSGEQMVRILARQGRISPRQQSVYAG
jgi:hypothetical protein